MKKIILSIVVCAFMLPVFAINQELGVIRLDLRNNNSSGMTNISVEKDTVPSAQSMGQAIADGMKEAVSGIKPEQAKEMFSKLKEILDKKDITSSEIYNGYSVLILTDVSLFKEDSPQYFGSAARMTKALKQRPTGETVNGSITKEKFIYDMKNTMGIYVTEQIKDKRVLDLYRNGFSEYIFGNLETGKRLLYSACNKYTGADRQWCLNYIETAFKKAEARELDITPYIEAIKANSKN